MLSSRDLRRREARRARAAELIGSAILDEIDAAGSGARGAYVKLLHKLAEGSKRETDRTILRELIEQFVGHPFSSFSGVATSYSGRLELVPLTSTMHMEAEVEDVLTQPSSYTLRTALGAIIGSVGLTFEEDAIGITDLRIEREYRGDRATERALQAIGSFAAQKNLHRLRVSLDRDRTRLIERFRSLGFEQNSRSGKTTILERSAEAENAV